MDWLWIIASLVVGLLIGGIVAYVTMRRRYGDQESIVQLRNEFEDYRNKVTGHFVETADLVNTLTRNYKNVYDHLEAGAYELVGEETLRKRLDTVDEAPVLIEYIGQRRRGVERLEAEAHAAPGRGLEGGSAEGRVAEHRKPSSRPAGDALPGAAAAPEPAVENGIVTAPEPDAERRSRREPATGAPETRVTATDTATETDTDRREADARRETEEETRSAG